MAVNTILKQFISRNLENGNSASARYYGEDPTTMGFNLWFDYGEESPLLNPPSGKGESAERYLRSIGETDRANSLVKFRGELKELTTKFPYYLQTINGLGEMYKFDSKNALDERVLEIITLESVDLRVAGMIDSYIKAYWDIDYRRCMLPYNLQQVTFTVLVSEIRNLRTFVKKTAGSTSSDSYKDLGAMLGTYSFQFHKSRFDFSGSNPFLDAVNNSVPEVATNKFKMECGKLHDGTRMNIFDILGDDSPSEKAREKTAFKDSTAFQIAKSTVPGVDQATNVFAAVNSAALEAKNLATSGQLTEREQAALLTKVSSLALVARNELKRKSSKEVSDEMDSVSKTSNRSVAEEERAFRLKKIFEENIPGYNLNPQEAVLNSLILTNLGNVFK